MDEVSHRQRIIALRAAVLAITGGPADRIAFGWHEDDQLVARLRVGHGFEYRTFDVPAEDGPLIAELVEWVLRPRRIDTAHK